MKERITTRRHAGADALVRLSPVGQRGSRKIMHESFTEESRVGLENGDGWLFAIVLSIITLVFIFVVGVLSLPDDDNTISLLWAGGLIVASKVITSWFPGKVSLRKPSFKSITVAVVAAFVIHVIMWWRPLAEGYLNHYYSYELFGRLVYVIILCIIFPITEEVYFRGLLFSVISLRFGIRNGAILSVILFIIYHTTSKGVLSLALLGGVSTWLAIRTDTLIPSIVMHITYNSLWLIQGIMLAKK